MALWQGDSKRSKTGRRIRYARGKRKFEIGRERHLTTIGKLGLKKVRTLGNNRKTRVKTTNLAYIVDPKNKKTTKRLSKLSIILPNRKDVLGGRYMTWKQEIAKNIRPLAAIAGLVIIVVSGHFQGFNGELTMAAIGILGTYAAIKKD